MKKTLLLMAALTAAIAVQAAKKYDLRYDLKPGQVLENKFRMDMSMKVMDISISMSITTDLRYEVEAKRDSLYDMKVSYTKLDYTLDAPMVPIPDSIRNAMSSVLFDMLTGKGFGTTMSDKGRIVSISGLDQLFDSEVTPPAGMPAEVFDRIKQQVKASFGSAAFRSNMEKSMTGYPAHEIAVGDSWCVSQSMDMQGVETAAKMTYRLVKVSRKGFVFEISGNVDIQNLKADGNMPDISGTIGGTMTADRKTGWPVRMDMTTDITVPATAKTPGMTMKGRVTLAD